MRVFFNPYKIDNYRTSLVLKNMYHNHINNIQSWYVIVIIVCKIDKTMTSFITISRDTVTDVKANENARYKRNAFRVLFIATGIHTKIGTNGFQKRLDLV